MTAGGTCGQVLGQIVRSRCRDNRDAACQRFQECATESFALGREYSYLCGLDERIEVLLLPDIVPKLNQVREPELLGLDMQGLSFRSVTDDAASRFDTARAQQR